MKLDVINVENKKIAEFEIDDNFINIKRKDDLVHDVLLAYLNSQHTGSSNTKTRAEVRGGGKKPWKQKGTGQARHGSIRSPIWKGGGVVFGPRPLKVRFKVNKNAKKEAMRQVVAGKLKDGEITIVESIEIKEPKTKSALAVLKQLNLAGSKVLLVNDSVNDIFLRATRNIGNLQVTRPENLNIYDLLSNSKVLMTKKSMEALIRRIA